ncbi:MAG TPA: hypothetical protein ENO09_03110, partial [bacterium]|nr:hypothetical protein [bacterium]
MQRRTALRLLSCAPFGLGALGCASQARIDTQSFLLYGMLIQLSLPSSAPVPIESALNTVERLFKQEYAIIHPWQDSPLTRLNTQLPKG